MRFFIQLTCYVFGEDAKGSYPPLVEIKSHDGKQSVSQLPGIKEHLLF